MRKSLLEIVANAKTFIWAFKPDKVETCA